MRQSQKYWVQAENDNLIDTQANEVDQGEPYQLAGNRSLAALGKGPEPVPREVTDHCYGKAKSHGNR